MSFETMNWSTEPERLNLAFDFLKCTFTTHRERNALGLRPISNKIVFGGSGILKNGLTLIVDFDIDRRYFCLQRTSENIIDDDEAVIVFNWDDSVQSAFPFAELATELAKGLYHLELLTPEVEAALKVSISAHQKMEWTLEFERRTNAVKVR